MAPPVRSVAWASLLLLAGCGPAPDDGVGPVPQASSEGSNQLMNAAEQAAGNAEARMSAETGNTSHENLQGETKR